MWKHNFTYGIIVYKSCVLFSHINQHGRKFILCLYKSDYLQFSYILIWLANLMAKSIKINIGIYNCSGIGIELVLKLLETGNLAYLDTYNLQIL